MNSNLFYLYLSFIVPFLASLIIFLFGSKRILYQNVSILSILITFYSTLNVWHKINLSVDNSPMADHFFFIDGVSILMQLMVEFVTLSVVLYSSEYLRKIDNQNKPKVHYYYSVILMSLSFMNLSFITNNLLFMYVFIELSSILVVYLISFRMSKESLQASFKYLIVVNLGILFSLIGIIFLYYFSGINLSITQISVIVNSLPKELALICGGLLIIGFFTKAGLIPFHIWLPDSYSESPSPISVFLTGTVTKLGIYGIIRTVHIFSVNLYEIKLIIIILASASMFIGAILSFNQKDIKKLISYCSISEMGFIASALALSSYCGIYGGIFHLINHTLIKGLLFFTAGIIIYNIGNREIENLRIRSPLLSAMFFVGSLAVGGMPFFGSFLSSITIFFALYGEGFILTSIILVLSGFISTIALLRTSIRIFWLNSNSEQKYIKTPKVMVLTTFIFMVLLIILGLYPELIYPLIDNASNSTMKFFNK